ncbi:MAG: extracellular solute-binding protein [Oscillospiraceae bacterium]|nr:extracellular solute-binding protein [Oscillospiraceae bacterium]
MKKFLALILALAMVLALVACGGKTPTPTPTPGKDDPATTNELAGTYDITVWVADNIVDLTKKQIDDFNANNTDGIKFNATVEPVGEGDAATNMITDVEAGGDLFCFAQDQFARLVQANALSKLGTQAGEMVKNANDAGAVAAATIDGELYAYPLTADNGYFMYYDKSVIPEEHLDSLEAIIADCEAAGKNFSMETETSAWYIASFFFGTGCVSEWSTDTEGNWSLNDTFNSDKGLIAAKGLKKLEDSAIHVSSSASEDFEKGSAVVVTGPWAFNTIQGILGDNMGATDLPSFEVDGNEYHMGSFSGFKLMGVKPQTDAVKAAALHKLAQYLTGEQGQMERFEAVAWGPSNINDQNAEAVQANIGLSALREQAPYATLQGQIAGSWWDIAKVIGTNVKEATDEAGLQAALDAYTASIKEFLNMDPEAAQAWSVIGAICGTNWDTDFPMTETAENTFQSEVLELKADDQLKVRQGASWDVNFPAENVVVEADGSYIVQLVINGTEGEVTLIAQ